MAVLALLVPSFMLGVILLLGRYEDFLLPPVQPPEEPAEPGLGSLRR
ncbi:hypothetical protein HTV45_25440 [Streptomyces sp. CHD11]|nr:hypothetical protein [Streptomyces sp. CHD11]MBT3154174.1 hypothetical protein [Streptomyces sp. CHD11]